MSQLLWLKPGILGAVIGAIALAIVGFNSLGWVTQSAAESLALKRADAAVIQALIPVCVAQAKSDPQSGPLLQELGGLTSQWDRRAFIEKTGWAMMPGDGAFNRDLAAACAQALKELEAA